MIMHVQYLIAVEMNEGSSSLITYEYSNICNDNLMEYWYTVELNLNCKMVKENYER